MAAQGPGTAMARKAPPRPGRAHPRASCAESARSSRHLSPGAATRRAIAARRKTCCTPRV
eukprot:4694458-Prymnesium_polylepis.2